MKAWVKILAWGCLGFFWFTSKNVQALCLQYCWFESDIGNCLFSSCISSLGVSLLWMQLLSIWNVGISFSVDRSSYLLYRHWKMSAYMHSNFLYILTLFMVLVSDSQTSEIFWELAQVAHPTENDAFCLACTHVFCSSVSVGSSAAESMSTVFRLGWMENDVNPYFLPNSFRFCLIYG